MRARLVAAVAAVLGAYACGGEGIVLPDDSVPAGIEVVGGNGQAAPAGATLAQALRVQVTDALGRPVANHEVAFSIAQGGGQISPASGETDADGVASATWTLGPSTGPQRARAQVTSEEAPDDLLVEFTATAVSGEGSTLVMVSGDAQTGAVGSALGSPLVVRVVDPLGNPVSGQTVSWSVVGGGSIGPTSSVTGEDGLASAQRVLGPTAGAQSALATAEGLAGSPVTFTHTASASNPTSFVRVSGNAQSAPAGFQLPESLVVRLLDANGNGVGGRTVTWVVASTAGAVDPVNSQTDAEGYAVTRWTLGSVAGSHSLNAVFSGLPSLTFTATATADAPTTVALLSGDNQTGAVGTTLPAPLRVRVTDANGNGVENVSVTWAAVGGGSVSSTTSGTNAQGVAEVSRTLGPTPGTQNTTATVANLAGSPVTFTSTAEVGPPARLAFVTQPAGALVGQALPAFQVEVQDAQGNRVANATNQVTITSSVAGTLQGDNTENAAAGVATFGAIALDEAGAGYRLTARASGLSNAVSDPFDIAQGATTVAITGRNPGSSVTGQPVTISYDVNVVAPASGGLSGTVTVSDGLGGSCTGGVTSGGGTGSCSIAFGAAGGRTLTATYSGDDNFTGSSGEGVAHTVARASTTVSVTGDSPDPSAAGQEVTVEYRVTVNSPGGGTPTGDVVITVAGGSETCTAPVAAGSCALTLVGAGIRPITARYAGDDSYNGDTDEESHTVLAPTSTSIASSLNPSDQGEDVTFTATVTSGAGTPTGRVQFTVDGAEVGPEVALTGGQATLVTSALAPGSREVAALFLGSTSFAASMASLTQVVNAAPIANGDSYTVAEDGGLTTPAALGVLANDTDDQTLTATLVTPPAHAAAFQLNADGSFSYSPTADYSGPDSFVYRASDGSLDDQASVSITVSPVNDPPSFTAGPNLTVSSTSSAAGVTVPDWAQDISPGPNEAGQTVTFEVSTTHPEAFSAAPAISSSGTLTFTPVLRFETVVVTVTVTARDNLGTASPAQQFTITINS